MLRIAVLLCAASLTLGFYRCSNGRSNPQVNTLSPGEYSYTARDSGGKTVIAGTLKLTDVKGESIKGTWNLKQVGPGDKLGPQVGTGDFVGQIGQEGNISINLNPNWADNNIFLNGKFQKGELTGDWHFSTFAGPTTKGTFTIKRK